MSYTIQRETTHDDPRPWPVAEPTLTSAATIDVEWTSDPEKVWTFEGDWLDKKRELLVRALGATVVHWGGLPHIEPEAPEVRQAAALVAYIEACAKDGDETAIAAQESRVAAKVSQ